MNQQTTLIAFDLDDTLFTERDFEASGFRAAAVFAASLSPLHVQHFAPMQEYAAENRSAMHPFDAYIAYLQAVGLPAPTVAEMKEVCRMHEPEIELRDGAEALLDRLTAEGYRLGIVTDGRVITQLNKVRALGLLRWFEPRDIVVSQAVGSDKTTPAPFQRIASLHPECDRFVYIGDNPAKDFRHPNLLGWQTIQLDDPHGVNVHPQSTASLTPDHLPSHHIATLPALIEVLSTSDK